MMKKKWNECICWGFKFALAWKDAWHVMYCRRILHTLALSDLNLIWHLNQVFIIIRALASNRQSLSIYRPLTSVFLPNCKQCNSSVLWWKLTCFRNSTRGEKKKGGIIGLSNMYICWLKTKFFKFWFFLLFISISIKHYFLVL